MTRRTSGVFIVWRAYQGRVDAMQAAFGYQPHYLGFSFANRALRPVEYLVKSLLTAWILLRQRPREVWLQVPPTVKLYIAALYKLAVPDVRLVADCHNILLERPWVRTPLLRTLLRHVVDVALVHNDHVYRRAIRLGLPAETAVVLETAPARPPDDGVDAADDPLGYQRPWAVFPASFKADEPIAELLDAVGRFPELTLVVTGDPRRADGVHDLTKAPANVTFTGWVDRRTYKRLVADADVVVGLTLLPDVQLSVANEAVGFGRAMVLSDTPVTRELFPRGAVYVSPEAASLLEGLREGLRRKDALERASRLLRGERVERWVSQATEVAGRLGRRVSDGREPWTEPTRSSA